MAIGKVSLNGMVEEDSIYTFLCSSTVVAGTDEGKAVSLDTSAANTVKLAAANDRLFGYIDTIEVRAVEGVTVVAVVTEFIRSLPHLSGEVFEVGDTAVGGGSGQVKVLKSGSPAASAPDPNQNIVLEVLASGDPVVMMR
jgi:hypothetical protein